MATINSFNQIYRPLDHPYLHRKPAHSLHCPVAWLTDQPDPLAVAAWQMVVWPLLAGLALVTIGPVLRLLPERLRLSRRGAWMGLGAMASAGASFVLMNRATASPSAWWALCWLLAALGAGGFQVAGRRLQGKHAGSARNGAGQLRA